MPTLRLSLLAAALLALVLAPTPAEAQRRSSASPEQASTSPARPFSAIERRGDLLARRLSTGLDQARRTQRRAEARCLSDHLTQVHSLLRQVELRQEPGASPIASARLAHMTQVFSRRLGALDAGSRACQGGAESEGHGTVVVTEIDASVPTEDPSRLPGDPPPIFSLPAPRSPAI